MSLPTQKLTPEQQECYRVIIDIYKKMNQELLRLRGEIKKLKAQAEESEEKEKVKDVLHKIINTID